jgi:hypothetical protein
MDTSTPTQQNQTPPTVAPTSLTDLAVKPTASTSQAPQSFSGHPEQAPIQSGSASENADDEVVQPAKQEVSTSPSQPATEGQKIEVQPTVPEVAIEKNIEHVVEKSPDTEKPQLSQAVKAAGVTLSGPGIPVDENVFGVKSLPMTYEEALVQDKQTKMKDSKHWLAELVMYVWRKLDPTIGKKKGVKN